MILIKTASGKKTIKISKSEWQSIGKTAGWIKTAACVDHTCNDCDHIWQDNDPHSNCPECRSSNNITDLDEKA